MLEAQPTSTSAKHAEGRPSLGYCWQHIAVERASAGTWLAVANPPCCFDGWLSQFVLEVQLNICSTGC